MKTTYKKNRNGLGRTCKNRVQFYVDDEQLEFINELCKGLKCRKTYIFRWLLKKEFEKRVVVFDVDKKAIC